jgi:hypothetical protein
MQKISEILENDKQNFVLKKGILRTYVLQKYIDTNIGKIEGSTVSTLGLLPYRWYENIKAADEDKPSASGTLCIPSYIKFYPQDVDSDKDVLIYPESYVKPYCILTFGDGYKCFQSEIIQDLDNVTLYEETFLDGRMDDNIPYDLLTPSWIKNMTMNDISLHVPVTTLSTITAQLCRDPKNMDKRWSEVIATQKNPKMIGYRFANIREMSASSVFGGLSFEDFNYTVDIALSMSKENREQKISPIEDILKL